MEFPDVLSRRKSCRQYKDKDVRFNSIESIEWAGSRAPYASGGPRRNWYITLDKETKLKMQEASFNQEYVGSCGAIVTVCGIDCDAALKSGHQKYIFDCAAAAMCMDLMAISMGLGTCWIGHFDADKVKEIIKTRYKPTILLLVGYPVEN